MAVRKGHHRAYNIHYHIVFPIKYRKVLLNEPTVATLKTITYDIQDRYELEIEQLGADRDHIHLLCSAHPKYAPGQLVRLYKSITARELFKRHPELKKELWGGELWSDGYYVATVGEKGNWSVVERYIRDQGHKPQDVQLRLL